MKSVSFIALALFTVPYLAIWLKDLSRKDSRVRRRRSMLGVAIVS
jgi:hypothetical protein